MTFSHCHLSIIFYLCSAFHAKWVLSSAGLERILDRDEVIRSNRIAPTTSNAAAQVAALLFWGEEPQNHAFQGAMSATAPHRRAGVNRPRSV